MADPGTISRGFMIARPNEAARVLGRLDPAEVAAFLLALPAPVGAAPLAHMAPWKVARCLAAMDPASAAERLLRLPAAHRGRVMRAATGPQRESMLEQLPRRHARALRRQLRYPAALVGAWMSGDVITLAPDARAADALAALEAGGEREQVQVYVTDAERPLGVVAVSTLLHVPAERCLRELMRREIAPLPADAPLFRFESDRGWRGLLERPVVDARGRLLGALSLGQLAAARERAGPAPTSGAGPAAALAGGYAAAMAGLARTATAWLTTTGTRDDR